MGAVCRYVVMFAVGVFVCYGAEQQGNPHLSKLGVEHVYTGPSPAATWRAKEVGLVMLRPRCLPP